MHSAHLSLLARFICGLLLSCVASSVVWAQTENSITTTGATVETTTETLPVADTTAKTTNAIIPTSNAPMTATTPATNMPTNAVTNDTTSSDGNGETVIRDKTLYEVLIHVRHCDQLYNQAVTFDSQLFSGGTGIAFIKASKTAFCQISVQPAGESSPIACDYTKQQLAGFFDPKVDQKVRDFDNKTGSLFEIKDMLTPIIDCYKQLRAKMAKDAGVTTTPTPKTIIKKTGDQEVITEQQPDGSQAKPIQKDNANQQQYDYGKLLQ